jgi:thiamine transporter ThiT
MNQFFKDVKKGLILQAKVLLVLLVPVLIIAFFFGEKASMYASIGLGILGGIYIVHYERKHKWWDN